MLPKIIAQLVDSIPADMRPYAAEASMTDVVGAGGNMLIVNYAYAMMDPAFGWKYAMAFAKATKPLPAVVSEPYIRAAHDYLISGKCSDNLLGTFALREESMKLARGLLEALLLVAPAMPLERIGELCCLPVAMIEKYEALFFSVRDRADDLCYRAAIAYPKTRQVEFQPDYIATVDPCDLLKRAAVRGGVDVVLELFGAVTSRSSLTDKELARILRTNILAEAAWLAQAGMIHQPLRIFDRALRLINSSERAVARAQEAATRVAAHAPAASSKPGFAVLQRVGAMLESRKPKLSYKWHSGDQPLQASECSGASDTITGASDRLIANPRNPYFDVAVPSGRGRDMSWAFAAPNRSEIATVTV